MIEQIDVAPLGTRRDGGFVERTDRVTIQATGTATQLPATTAATSAAGSADPTAATDAAGAASSGAPSSVSGIMSMLTTRYKPLSVNGVAQAVAQAVQALGVNIGAATQQAATGQGVTAAGSGTSVDPAAEAAAEQQAEAQAQAQQQAQAQAQAQQQAATQQAPATASTSSNTSSSGATYNYWTAHIAQYKGPYLPDGPAMAPNCGPASVTMALRLVGLQVPGTNGKNTEATLDTAREIGTGENDQSVGTTDQQLEKVIDAAGGKWTETKDLNQVLSWARNGTPTILAGDPAKGWDDRYTSNQVYPFDGGHWVVVSGYDPKTGFYVVNDPLSQIGPIEVSATEIQNYMSAEGDLGIGVFGPQKQPAT